MMMDKVSSSGSISHKVGTCRVEDASMNSSVIHAKVVDNISSSANIGRLIVGKSIEVDIHNNPIVHTTTQIVVESSSGHIMTTNPNQMENGGKILDSSAMHDTIINVDNTDTAYERCISQNEGIENNVVLMSERKKIQRNTSSGYLSGNALCCKVSVIFGVCCIIGIYLIPIILYYVGQIRGNPETNPEFSHEKNTSIAKVCCKSCKCTRFVCILYSYVRSYVAIGKFLRQKISRMMHFKLFTNKFLRMFYCIRCLILAYIYIYS